MRQAQCPGQRRFGWLAVWAGEAAVDMHGSTPSKKGALALRFESANISGVQQTMHRLLGLTSPQARGRWDQAAAASSRRLPNVAGGSDLTYAVRLSIVTIVAMPCFTASSRPSRSNR
jgi:hypothetical protein